MQDFIIIFKKCLTSKRGHYFLNILDHITTDGWYIQSSIFLSRL